MKIQSHYNSWILYCIMNNVNIDNDTSNASNASNTNNADGGNNAIQIDIDFTRAWNNLGPTADVIEFVHAAHYTNVVFHPRQITNLFDVRPVYQNGAIVLHPSCKPSAQFMRWMQRQTYADMCRRVMRPLFSNDFSGGETLVLVFIGTVDVGVQLIQKVVEYRHLSNNNNHTVAVAWCVTERLVSQIKPILPQWSNSAAFASRELGSDITPTLLTYECLCQKHPNAIAQTSHIIKVHTKRKPGLFNRATDFVLQYPPPPIPARSACAGFQYVSARHDMYNRQLMRQYADLLVRPCFVPTTIFRTTRGSFERVLAWFRQHYMTCLLQNMYDTNRTNMHSSCAHFMERLFGYVQ